MSLPVSFIYSGVYDYGKVLSTYNGFSHTEYRHGFEWDVRLSHYNRQLEIDVTCRPITDSLSDDWVCGIDCSVYIPSFKLHNPSIKRLASGSHCFRRKPVGFFGSQGSLYFPGVISMEQLKSFVVNGKFTLICEFTIERLLMGKASLPIPDADAVSFQRLIHLDDLELGVSYRSTHPAYPRSWDLVVQLQNDRLMCAFAPINNIINIDAKLPPHNLQATITLTEQNGDRANKWKFVGKSETENYIPIAELSRRLLMSVTLTRSPDKTPDETPNESPDETPYGTPDETSASPISEKTQTEKTPKLNFGREALSVPQFGNFTLILGDGTQLKLNSYILSYNSPELRRLIVDTDIIEHDVTDFDSAAVRIFVDACYTGTLEKLMETTEFSVFKDLVKMFAVFKVTWPEEGCLEFYKATYLQLLATFPGLTECSQFAVKISTKFKLHEYLDLTVTGIADEVWRRVLPRALKKASTKSDMDFIMAVTVEKELIPEFISLIAMLPDYSGRSKNLLTVLENFNFALCDKEAVEELCQDLLENCEEGQEREAVRNFARIVGEETGESSTEVATADGDGGGDSGGGGGSGDGGKALEDGTLATIARMLWARDQASMWPCSKKRPFSDVPRKLLTKKGD